MDSYTDPPTVSVVGYRKLTKEERQKQLQDEKDCEDAKNLGVSLMEMKTIKRLKEAGKL